MDRIREGGVRTGLALLLAALALAGCAAPVADPSATTQEGGIVDSLTFIDCARVFSGPLPMSPGSTARFMPPGFRPVLPGGAPAELLGVDLVHCGTITGPGFEARDVGYAEWYVPVDPPEEFRSEDASNYAVSLGHMTSSATFAAVLRSWGAEVTLGGPVEIDLDETPATRSSRATTADERTALRVEALQPATTREFAGVVGRVFLTRADGSAREVAGAIEVRIAPSAFAVGPSSFEVDGEASAFPAASARGPAGHHERVAGVLQEFAVVEDVGTP